MQIRVRQERKKTRTVGVKSYLGTSVLSKKVVWMPKLLILTRFGGVWMRKSVHARRFPSFVNLFMECLVSELCG